MAKGKPQEENDLENGAEYDDWNDLEGTK